MSETNQNSDDPYMSHENNLSSNGSLGSIDSKEFDSPIYSSSVVPSVACDSLFGGSGVAAADIRRLSRGSVDSVHSHVSATTSGGGGGGGGATLSSPLTELNKNGEILPPPPPRSVISDEEEMILSSPSASSSSSSDHPHNFDLKSVFGNVNYGESTRPSSYPPVHPSKVAVSSGSGRPSSFHGGALFATSNSKKPSPKNIDHFPHTHEQQLHQLQQEQEQQSYRGRPATMNLRVVQNEHDARMLQGGRPQPIPKYKSLPVASASSTEQGLLKDSNELYPPSVIAQQQQMYSSQYPPSSRELHYQFRAGGSPTGQQQFQRYSPNNNQQQFENTDDWQQQQQQRSSVRLQPQQQQQHHHHSIASTSRSSSPGNFSTSSGGNSNNTNERITTDQSYHYNQTQLHQQRQPQHPQSQQQSYQQYTQYQPQGSHPQLGDGSFQQFVYQVQFKYAFRYFVLAAGLSPAMIRMGDFVKVEADRGEDLGVVTDIMSMKEFVDLRVQQRISVSIDDDSGNIRNILRLATMFERQNLTAKMQDEQNVLNLCQQLVSCTYKLPMSVVGAEYQFDRHKLTISYCADRRIDFRELVRDLFGACKARIWMRKVNEYNQFQPKEYAVMALSTGMQFAPSN